MECVQSNGLRETHSIECRIVGIQVYVSVHNEGTGNVDVKTRLDVHLFAYPWSLDCHVVSPVLEWCKTLRFECAVKAEADLRL